MKKLVVLLISLIFSSVIFAQNLVTLKAGDSIPEFKYYTLEGKELDSKGLLGKKLLVNFTATWCPYCVAEKEKFEKEYKELQSKNDNMEIVVVFGPYGRKVERRDTTDKVKEYMAKGNLTFPVYFDNNREVIEKFGVNSVPTSFLIDEKGKVIEVSEEYYKLNSLKK